MSSTAFSGGKRICIGKNFAEIIPQAIVAMIIS
jgi:cytochrome P450